MKIVILILINTLFISFTMIVFGLIFMKKPPKDINSMCGYRTPMSSKNQDTWMFAHKYAGRVWFYSGVLTVVLSSILIFILRDSDVLKKIISPLLILQVSMLLLPIPLTEIALRKTFDKNGKFKD